MRHRAFFTISPGSPIRTSSACLLVAIASGLLLAASARSAPAAELRARAGPNVVFLLIDTLRADRLGAYGHERPTSPTIDLLAKFGVRFARVRSQASWTKASMWTSLHPSSTGVLRFSHALPERARMPAEILKAAGYRTAGLWRNGWVAPDFGFGQGFDHYLRPPPSADVTRLGDRSGRPTPTDLDLTESATEFLRTFRDQRFFLYVHYMDVHQYVYDAESARFGTAYADAYDNAIHWVDRNIGALLAELDALGRIDDTLVVIAADHGEEFDDHGSEGHGRTLYDEDTHTPWILSQPGLLPAARPGVVVEDRVQDVDVWPTLLDLLGLPPLPEAQGRSRLPEIERAIEGDEDAAPQSEGVTYSHIDRVWGRTDQPPLPLVSVTEGGWRRIHPVTPPGVDQLFDLARDPAERYNVAAEHADRVERLRRRIDALLARKGPWSEAPRVELDTLRLDQLRALGDLGGAGDAGKRSGQAPSD